MPSTFTNNGGIELPADGEKDGVWGDVVNTNMAIIDRLTNGVGSVTLSGTTHTLSTANGALSDGQYDVIVFGGAPSDTNVVTISPNDAQKTYLIKNATSQIVTMSQGSGASVDVSPGFSAIVYADGTGTSASVYDFTASIKLSLSNAGVTATVAELNILDGVTSTTAELNILDGVTSTTAELNILDGVTATAAELNLLDGVTSTTAELNILDGVTSTTAELNILDGVTATTAELNILDGVTATAAELNLLDGATLDVGAVTATAAEVNLLDGKGIATAAEYRAATPNKILEADDVWASGAVVALTDGASIAVNMSTGFNFSVTLGGNRTLVNPNSPKVGQTGFIRVAQDGVGSRTLTLSSSYVTQGGGGVALTASPGAVDVLFY
jgi:hypothetical protein